jgi:hypothetical protein
VTISGADLISLLRDYGLPLVILVLFVVCILRGWLVTGRELDRKVSLLEADHAKQATLLEQEVDYREQRRIEERQSRTAAEERMAAMIDVMKQHTELLGDIEREVLRNQGLLRGRRNDPG